MATTRRRRRRSASTGTPSSPASPTDPEDLAGAARVDISDDAIRESLEGAPAEAAARARHRPHAVLAAGQRHGPPPRQRSTRRCTGPSTATTSSGGCATSTRRTSRRSASSRSRPARRSSRRCASCGAAWSSSGSSAATSTRIRAAGYWTGPPLFDRSWYPLYEAMVELDVPAHGPRERRLQPALPHHRLALPRRRHHGASCSS